MERQLPDTWDYLDPLHAVQPWKDSSCLPRTIGRKRFGRPEPRSATQALRREVHQGLRVERRPVGPQIANEDSLCLGS
jgi:hypothetical protein